MLALCISLWAQTGLAIPPADAIGMHCHHDASLAHLPAVPESGQAPPPSWHHAPANALPCCPSQSEPVPSGCGDRPCCVESDEPVRPLAFLVLPGMKLSKQIIAYTQLNGAFSLRETQRTYSRAAAKAALYVQPVTEKKTDLRS
jgi:hypothetical protein